MLNQNWFYDKKFVMFDEYFDTQCFYDVETSNIYVVSQLDDGNVQIVQHTGEKNDVAYPNLYCVYEEYLGNNQTSGLNIEKETVYTDYKSYEYDDKLILNEEEGYRYERKGRTWELAEGVTYGGKARKSYAIIFAIDISYPTEGDKTKSAWWSMCDDNPKELLENCREYIK